eukprot:CAMPEP_0119133048 /NCGR_PEP_ID=MMETSP1310-20130426/12867_1 /TAXON_ID=464262 /ORGANISM="Genus nov. species nov., Strain RCC2339" /LENGTH=70 /DNA_ID=CAMNT_0007123721 /DNA_START=268 /DNA_END=480 /DNA_ORIENTATION=-
MSAACFRVAFCASGFPTTCLFPSGAAPSFVPGPGAAVDDWGRFRLAAVLSDCPLAMLGPLSEEAAASAGV